MVTINTWINFNGNAEEAFTFYKSVFGGEFTKIVRFKDIASEKFFQTAISTFDYKPVTSLLSSFT